VPRALPNGRRSRCHCRSTQSGGTRRPMRPALWRTFCPAGAPGSVTTRVLLATGESCSRSSTADPACYTGSSGSVRSGGKSVSNELMSSARRL
jgi:hypothetical protein